MSITRGGLSSGTLQHAPPSKSRVFPAAQISNTPVLPCVIWLSENLSGRTTCRQVQPQVHVCLPAIPYCSAKDGFIPGPHGGVYATSTQHQLRQTMRNLLDNLEEAEMNFNQVVAINVYLDDVSDLPVFDQVYGQYFRPVPPARTTVQQIAPAERRPDK